MTIRRRVQAWAAARGINIRGDLRTSKYYPADQSRSKRDTWWVEVPVDKLDSVEHFEVFCEKAVETDDFHHLRIPATYFKENEAKFYTTNGKISVWLSAAKDDLFRDTHPEGRHLDFGRFLSS